MSKASVTAAQSPGRIPELDALRGVAVGIVVLCHYFNGYDAYYGHPQHLGFNIDGTLGVYLFFAISGFVILMTLERSPSLLSFAWSRASRLYPAFWVALGLTFMATHLFPIRYKAVSLEDALVNLSMIPTILGVPEVDGVYWSLGVELEFYLLLALCYRFFLKLWPQLTLLGFLVLELGASSLSGDHAALALFKHDLHFFVIGMLAYQVRSAGRISAAAVLLGLSAVLVGFWVGLGPTTLFVAVIFAIHALGALRWLAWSPLVFLGGISFSLYLLHQNLGYILMQRLYGLGLGMALVLPLTLIAALALATALTFWVERPAMVGLRRFAPGRKGQPA